MRNLLQSMSGVQLRLLWDRNIFIVLMKATSVSDEALHSSSLVCADTWLMPCALAWHSAIFRAGISFLSILILIVSSIVWLSYTHMGLIRKLLPAMTIATLNLTTYSIPFHILDQFSRFGECHGRWKLSNSHCSCFHILGLLSMCAGRVFFGLVFFMGRTKNAFSSKRDGKWNTAVCGSH